LLRPVPQQPAGIHILCGSWRSLRTGRSALCHGFPASAFGCGQSHSNLQVYTYCVGAGEACELGEALHATGSRPPPSAAASPTATCRYTHIVWELAKPANWANWVNWVKRFMPRVPGLRLRLRPVPQQPRLALPLTRQPRRAGLAAWSGYPHTLGRLPGLLDGSGGRSSHGVPCLRGNDGA